MDAVRRLRALEERFLRDNTIAFEPLRDLIEWARARGRDESLALLDALTARVGFPRYAAASSFACAACRTRGSSRSSWRR
jgi:hypothetical protein